MTEKPDLDSPESSADWEALARYLAGESPPAEAEAVRRWLDARPDRAALVALGGALDRLAFVPPSDLDVEAALRRVHERMAEPDVRPLVPRADRQPPRPMFRQPQRGLAPNWLRVAAAIVFIAAGAVVWRLTTRQGAVTPERVLTTAVGQRDSTRLPDGSRVILGPGSELRIAAGFGDRERSVSLRGEAFFDVVHDASRPFVVHAGDAVIRDLGTTFAVHSDRAEGVRVVVTSGAVRLTVAGGDSGVVLRPNDRAALGAAGHVAIERSIATDEDLAWTQGRLVFRDAPLPQVMADLKRWYGIDLVLADSSLAGKHFNNTFAQATPRDVMNALALAFGATGELHGDTIVLRAARAPAAR